jgi:Ca2+-binding RTX toxin-like protein
MHLPITTAAIAAGLLGAGFVTSADAAQPGYSVKLKHETLLVKGGPGGDALALRLRVGAPQTLQVDIGDDGSADFEVSRDRFSRIVVKAGGGDDSVRIDESGGAFTTTTPTTIDGQHGDDTLLGGSGNEVLVGGSGDDVVDGNRGADTADLGAGDDRFVWDPGDGSDVVDGGTGRDAMTFNGANIAERFAVFADGSRVRFTRDVGLITMDLGSIEDIDTNALGGNDVFDGSGVTDPGISLHTDGGDGDDMIVGGAGSDTLLGGAGDDVLRGGPGLDILDGGPGNNVVIQD